MTLDLLAFAAHRDDIEITCGGTLIRMVEQGYKVGACELTQGEMGTRGSSEERRAEAEEGGKILGLAARINCGFPDAGLFNTREFQERIVEILREYRPQVVILPGPQQRHPDHRITPQIVYDACFLSGLEKFGRGEKFRPRKILHVHTSYEERRPTFVVDITDQMERKIASVLAYRTQFPDPERVNVWLKGMARAYGLMIGATYGEGFLQREVMRVDDVVAIPGTSI
jgi:bacillithiol biosynthesis deacetylase BshB1